MNENKIREMIVSALLNPMPEKINSKEYVSNRKQSKSNPIDTITMDVPLFIRMMEFAREDAKSDLDLHDVAEKAISLSNSGKTLTMSDYETMFGGELNEAQSSSNESLAKKVEEVVKSLTTLHKNTSNNSNIPETDKKGLLRAFDMLKGDLETVVTNLKGGLSETKLDEKKLTTAEKHKKEDIVKAMKKSFKGNKGIMYAIATDKAKKLAEVNLKASKLSSAEYQKAKKLKDFKASDWKWNTDEDLYVKVNEDKLTEAYVPDNIKKFAKERGVSSLVNKAAGWAEKVGKRITGGTAIGKNYSTLILDMGYQTGDIRINTEDETIELYGEEVNSFPEFKKIYMDENAEDKIEENVQDDDVLGDMILDMLKYKTKEEVSQYLRQQVALHYDDVKDNKPKTPKGKMEEGMGNEVGDVVYFKGNLGKKYPASQGYYGVIEDVTPASNYNMLATYQVVVCDENDDEVGIVNTSFLNLSSKLKISTPKLKSMAETIMSKLKGK